MPNPPPELVKEQYQLRSTFFLNQLDDLGFFDQFGNIRELGTKVSKKLDWSARSKWAIQEDAWANVSNAAAGQEIFYFIHPNIISAYPTLIRYYRCVNLLPIKGLQRISGVSNVDGLERGAIALGAATADKLTAVLNENMSVMMRLSHVDEERLKGMMFATAGTSIDGSWRNKIGVEGERVVRAFLAQSLQSRGFVEAVGLIDGKILSATDASKLVLAEEVSSIRQITCTNGSQVVFGSEPDIELRSAGGAVLGGIEIKAGLDPAGALERLGAMLKSFESIISKDPDAQTILIASCITSEVQSRLNKSKAVSQIFTLTDVMNNKKGQQQVFVNEALMILELVARRT